MVNIHFRSSLVHSCACITFKSSAPNRMGGRRDEGTAPSSSSSISNSLSVFCVSLSQGLLGEGRNLLYFFSREEWLASALSLCACFPKVFLSEEFVLLRWISVEVLF